MEPDVFDHNVELMTQVQELTHPELVAVHLELYEAYLDAEKRISDLESRLQDIAQIAEE